MKTNRIIMTAAVLGLLAAGCGRENGGRINIFAENMHAAGDSKLLMDPANIDVASFLSGEKLNLNGHEYTISGNETDGYSVNIGSDEMGSTLYAVYPATTSTNGNSIVTTNSSADNGEVVIKNLTLRFNGGKHEVYFPMATPTVASSSSTMVFEHLTGGLKLTLSNTSSTACTVATAKIVTQTDEAASTIASRNGVTARWDVQGPTVPSGEVGGIIGDQDMKYACEMHFNLKTYANDFVTIAAGESLTFFVPMTMSSVRKLTVAGFDANGAPVFTKSKDLGSAKSIEANKMYTIPTIEID